MKKQSRAVTVSWGDLADALARGDVAVTYNGWETIQKFAADKGKKIAYTYPKEGTYAWLDNYCIAKDAPNLDAAYEIWPIAVSMSRRRCASPRTPFRRSSISKRSMQLAPGDQGSLSL